MPLYQVSNLFILEFRHGVVELRAKLGMGPLGTGEKKEMNWRW